MQTPLDGYILKKTNKIFKNIKNNISITDYLTLSLAKASRVLYLKLLSDSWELQQSINIEIKNDKNKPSTRNLSIQETLEMGDDSTRCILSYFQFLEHINIFGRALKDEINSLPPFYYRIYFYRNKMIQHWDDYVHLLFGMGIGNNNLVFTKGKICIPYHNAAFFKPVEVSRLENNLKNDFSSIGIKLPSLKNRWNADYSKIIYPKLEQIDSKLKKIPENIVEDLFRYSFPTPITNIEEYFFYLANWLESI